MADVQSLFLQIDASVELLRQQMAKGDGILDGFGASADRMATRVDTAIGAMGSNFGRFEQQAQRAARVVERSFTDSFTAAQKTAASIAINPRTGRATAGAAEARAAATAAQGQAAALQLVATAAERDAASTGVMTRETMNYVQATRIAAIAAQRQAAELARDAGAAERLEIELNQLSREQLQAAAAANAHAAASNRATRTNGMQRAGMQQLGFQLSDVSVQYSMGTSAAQIFAMQSGQVIQALGMMTTRTSGFLAFMGGPWGAVIGAALVVLTPLVAKMFEQAKAEKAAEIGAESLGSAQSALGGMFDRTTGKLIRQNEQLRINARLTAANMRAEAAAAEIVAGQTFRDAGAGSAMANGARAALQLWTGADVGGRLGIGTGNDAVRALAGRARTANTIRDEGARTRAFERLIADAERTDFQGSGFTRSKFLEAIGKAATARANRLAAAEVDKSLNQGQLTSSLRDDAAPKKPKADNSAAKAAAAARQELMEDISFTAEERSARKRLIDAKQKTAATEAEADALAREEIDADAAALKTKYDLLEKAGKLDGAEATRLRGLAEDTRQQQRRNVAIATATRKLERQFDAQAQGLDAEIATLRLKLDLARTTGDRRTLAKQLLDAEQKQARLALERIRDTSQDPREVARAIANLKTMPDQQQLERDRLDGQNRGAIGDYRQSLIDATDDMDSALEGVAVGGLGQLEDGLVGVIDGTKSVGAAFRDMASSILSDLARIAIKKAILSAIGFAGFAEGGEIGSAPGYAGGGSPGGLIRGPGTGTSDSILALLGGGGAIRVSNEEFIVNAAATKRFLPLLHAINSGRLPGFAGGGAIGAPSIPRLSLPAVPRLSAPGGGGGGSRAPMVFDLRGALVTETLMRQINERISSAGAAAVVGGSQMAQDEARWQSSRELR